MKGERVSEINLIRFHGSLIVFRVKGESVQGPPGEAGQSGKEKFNKLSTKKISD